jgi:hypothetical protein
VLPYLLTFSYIATIPVANWLIENIGTFCVPNGPCLVPVGLGLTAPSGVLMIGFALVLRDLVQREKGPIWSLACVAAGAAVSFFIAHPALAFASTVAFTLSELADFAIYTPLRRRGFILAVIASSVVGSVIDSAAFLWFAFGSLDFLTGQIIGKIWAIIFAVSVMSIISYYRKKI